MASPDIEDDDSSANSLGGLVTELFPPPVETENSVTGGIKVEALVFRTRISDVS